MLSSCNWEKASAMIQGNLRMYRSLIVNISACKDNPSFFSCSDSYLLSLAGVVHRVLLHRLISHC